MAWQHDRVLPRGRGRPRDATYPKSTLLPAVNRGGTAFPPTHGPLPRAATAGGVATGPRSFMRSGMEAMISSRSLLPPTLRVCRQDRGEHEELWPPPWSPHRRGWSTPSAYSLWRSLLLFRSRGDRILPMCPSPTTSSSPGWLAWISPLLPSTSLPRARRSATMDPPAGGSREPAVLSCCSGEKVTWLSVHEEWSSVKYLYTWPLLLIHVHGEEQTTAHSCFVPLLCDTLLEVTFSYLSML